MRLDLTIFKVRWVQMFDGEVPTNCMVYDSMVIAESKQRAKYLILKRFGPSDIGLFHKIGEVTDDSEPDFHREGFFFLESQPLRA